MTIFGHFISSASGLWWCLAAGAVWVVAMLFFYSLCAAAGQADERMREFFEDAPEAQADNESRAA